MTSAGTLSAQARILSQFGSVARNVGVNWTNPIFTDPAKPRNAS